MDPLQQQQQQNDQDRGGGCRGGGSSSSYIFRQGSTSSRWTPTIEQIRILKDLYYNSGVRSPSTEQIQRISARLRQYGKIEGKNVFYWFQNHKARERQKKKFTSTNTTTATDIAHPMGVNTWKTDQYYSLHNNNKYQNNYSTTPAAGFGTVGQLGNYGHGSMTLEKNFKQGACSTSAAGCGSDITGGTISHKNFGCAGHVDHHHPYSYSQPYTGTATTSTLLDHHKRRSIDFTLEELQELDEEEEEEEEAAPEIETLPLFPIHSEDINGFCHNNNKNNYYFHGQYYSNWNRSGEGTGSTSLKLSLDSHTGISPE